MTSSVIDAAKLRELTGPDDAEPRWRRLARRSHAVAKILAFKAGSLNIGRTLPGFAGISLVSAGLGLRFGVWAGLITAGVFCLRIDNRI